MNCVFDTDRKRKLCRTFEKASLNSRRTIMWCWDKAFSWSPSSVCSLLVSDIQLIRRTKGNLAQTVNNYIETLTSNCLTLLRSCPPYSYFNFQIWCPQVSSASGYTHKSRHKTPKFPSESYLVPSALWVKGGDSQRRKRDIISNKYANPD